MKFKQNKIGYKMGVGILIFLVITPNFIQASYFGTIDEIPDYLPEGSTNWDINEWLKFILNHYNLTENDYINMSFENKHKAWKYAELYHGLCNRTYSENDVEFEINRLNEHTAHVRNDWNYVTTIHNRPVGQDMISTSDEEFKFNFRVFPSFAQRIRRVIVYIGRQLQMTNEDNDFRYQEEDDTSYRQEVEHTPTYVPIDMNVGEWERMDIKLKGAADSTYVSSDQGYTCNIEYNILNEGVPLTVRAEDLQLSDEVEIYIQAEYEWTPIFSSRHYFKYSHIFIGNYYVNVDDKIHRFTITDDDTNAPNNVLMTLHSPNPDINLLESSQTVKLNPSKISNVEDYDITLSADDSSGVQYQIKQYQKYIGVSGISEVTSNWQNMPEDGTSYKIILLNFLDTFFNDKENLLENEIHFFIRDADNDRGLSTDSLEYSQHGRIILDSKLDSPLDVEETMELETNVDDHSELSNDYVDGKKGEYSQDLDYQFEYLNSKFKKTIFSLDINLDNINEFDILVTLTLEIKFTGVIVHFLPDIIGQNLLENPFSVSDPYPNDPNEPNNKWDFSKSNSFTQDTAGSTSLFDNDIHRKVATFDQCYKSSEDNSFYLMEGTNESPRDLDLVTLTFRLPAYSQNEFTLYTVEISENFIIDLGTDIENYILDDVIDFGTNIVAAVKPEATGFLLVELFSDIYTLLFSYDAITKFLPNGKWDRRTFNMQQLYVSNVYIPINKENERWIFNGNQGQDHLIWLQNNDNSQLENMIKLGANSKLKQDGNGKYHINIGFYPNKNSISQLVNVLVLELISDLLTFMIPELLFYYGPSGAIMWILTILLIDVFKYLYLFNVNRLPGEYMEDIEKKVVAKESYYSSFSSFPNQFPISADSADTTWVMNMQDYLRSSLEGLPADQQNIEFLAGNVDNILNNPTIYNEIAESTNDQQAAQQCQEALEKIDSQQESFQSIFNEMQNIISDCSSQVDPETTSVEEYNQLSDDILNNQEFSTVCSEIESISNGEIRPQKMSNYIIDNAQIDSESEIYERQKIISNTAQATINNMEKSITSFLEQNKFNVQDAKTQYEISFNPKSYSPDEIFSVENIINVYIQQATNLMEQGDYDASYLLISDLYDSITFHYTNSQHDDFYYIARDLKSTLNYIWSYEQLKITSTTNSQNKILPGEETKFSINTEQVFEQHIADFVEDGINPKITWDVNNQELSEFLTFEFFNKNEEEITIDPRDGNYYLSHDPYEDQMLSITVYLDSNCALSPGIYSINFNLHQEIDVSGNNGGFDTKYIDENAIFYLEIKQDAAPSIQYGLFDSDGTDNNPGELFIAIDDDTALKNINIDINGIIEISIQNYEGGKQFYHQINLKNYPLPLIIRVETQDYQGHITILYITDLILDDDTEAPKINWEYTGDYTDGNPGSIIVNATDSSGLTEDPSGIYNLTADLGEQVFNFTAIDGDTDWDGDQLTINISVSIFIIDDDTEAPIIYWEYTGDYTDGNPGSIIVSVIDSSGLVQDPSGIYDLSANLGEQVIKITAIDADVDTEEDQLNTTLIILIFIEDDDTKGPEISYNYNGSGYDFDSGYINTSIIDEKSGIRKVDVFINDELVEIHDNMFEIPNIPGFYSILIAAWNNDIDRGIIDSECTYSSFDIEILDDDITGPLINVNPFQLSNPGWNISIIDNDGIFDSDGSFSYVVLRNDKIIDVKENLNEGNYFVNISLMHGYYQLIINATNNDLDYGVYDSENSSGIWSHNFTVNNLYLSSFSSLEKLEDYINNLNIINSNYLKCIQNKILKIRSILEYSLLLFQEESIRKALFKLTISQMIIELNDFRLLILENHDIITTDQSLYGQFLNFQLKEKIIILISAVISDEINDDDPYLMSSLELNLIQQINNLKNNDEYKSPFSLIWILYSTSNQFERIQYSLLYSDCEFIISIQLKMINRKLEKTICMIDFLYQKGKITSDSREQLLNGYEYVDLYGNRRQVLGILAIIKNIKNEIL